MKLRILLSAVCAIAVSAFGQAGLSGGAGDSGGAGWAAGAGAGSWTPTTPSNTLKEWVKADALSFSDGDPVGTWTASAGVDLTTFGATSPRPTFKTAIKNGKPVVRFDGVDDFLQSANFSSAQVQPYTVFIVFKWAGTGTPDYIIDGNDGSDRFIIRFDTSKFAFYFGSAVVDSSVAQDSNWHIVQVEANGASSTYRIDHGTKTTMSSSPGTQNLNGITLGAAYTAGSSVPEDVAEVIIYNSTLGSGDEESAWSYLNARWAIY